MSAMLRHHYFWPDRPALRAARWTTGGGRREPWGERQGEKMQRGRDGSGRNIGGKKPSEGTKASDQENERAFGNTERKRQGSAWIQRKVGNGGTGECSARSGMGRHVQEVTMDGKGGTEPYG